MIIGYLKSVIEKNYLNAKEKNVTGKFILRNYPETVYQKLTDSIDNPEILFVTDKNLNTKALKVSKEELAQFRNENVKNYNLKNVYYIVFITDNVIDTLNDLATLSVDDIKDVFLELLPLNLKKFFKYFLKEFEEADIFEIEKFATEITEKYENGSPLSEAVGESLIYSFRCKSCVNMEKLKDFFKEYKKLSNCFYKKNISNEDLLEAYNENKEEFENLGKKELIKEFIKADISDENYERFKSLDYREDLLYRLFEKINTPAKKLGEEMAEFLESKDILEDIDREFLEEFDSLPPREKAKKRDFLKEIYEKYKIILEENRKLLKKTEKFIFPKTIEENNFFTGLIRLIKETEAERIELSLNKKSKKAINESYSKYALNYLKHRIIPLKFDKVGFDIDLNYDFDNEKTSSRYTDLVFVAKVYKDGETEEKRFVFKYPLNSVLDGYAENLKALKKNLASNRLSCYKTYINKNFPDTSLKNYASFEKENSEGYMFVDESDDIKTMFEEIEKLDFVKEKEEFKEKTVNFLHSYKKALESFEIKELEESFNEILEFLHRYREYDIFKRKIIKPFLNLATVKVDKNLIIIPSFHPLRIIGFYYKIQKLNSVFNECLEGGEFIKEELFFDDLIYDFTSVHYPEIFKDVNFLKVSEVLDEYSLLENIKKETLSKNEEVNIFLNVIKDYLELNKHKKNIKIFIHSMKSLFPVELMGKLSKFSENIEIYFNDLNEKNIQNMYKLLLQREDVFKFNEIAFVSNIKLNTLQNSFKALDEYKDKFNLSFLKDFISEKAEITKEEQIYPATVEPFEYTNLISKRKFLSKKEERISKYLMNPFFTKTTKLFYSLIDERLIALSVSRDKEFENLEKIHTKSDWVVNLDEVADKKIIEDYGANVIKYKRNKFLNKNLIISSKANTKLLESNLKRKLKELNINSDVKEIIKQANEISGDIVLKALKQGKNTNELIGIVLANKYLQKNSSITVFIDDYENYFKQNSTLSDLLIITPEIKNKKLKLLIEIAEAKFCSVSSGLENKSFFQAANAYKLFSKIFSDEKYIDKENYKIKIADLIVENASLEDFNSEDIRAKILFEEFDVSVNSYSFMFYYDAEINEVYEEDNVKQYKFGRNMIKKIINGDKSGMSYSFAEMHKTKTAKTKSKPSKNIKNNQNDTVKKSIVKVFRYHNLKADITEIKYTPNAVRVSLKPQLGWKEAVLFKTKDDFLTVEGLELLRVEALKGRYDLVFKREERQTVYYKELIKNRKTEDGNTKILVGLDEATGEVVYYDLDSEDPHALIGGMTKSGKSVLLNLFIIDLITTNSPDELRLFLIDPKRVEFSRYKNIPHLEKIVTKKEEATEVLKTLVEEMEKRYELFEKEGVNEIKKYNKKVLTKLPRIAVIFDEFADWMLDKDFKKDVSEAIQSLSGKARAAGIHLIVSTQRPDNSVVVPILRANLGAKFALRVDSEKNSNIILDESGAEKLLGSGHMIAKFAGGRYYIQGAFISDEEIDEILEKQRERRVIV